MIDSPPTVDLKVPPEHQARLRELCEIRDRAQCLKSFTDAKAAKYLQRGRFAWRYYRLVKDATAATLAFERSQRDFTTFLNNVLPDTLVGQWCLHPDTMTAHRQERLKSFLEVLGGG